MPNSVSAVSARSSSQNKLRLKLSVSAGEPWPALNISAEAIVNGERVPAARLKAERGGFVCEAGTLTLDSLDALIVRTLLQLPRSGDNFCAAAREFAPVLALLRQHSENCVLEESERVAECEILTARPDCEVRIVELARASLPAGTGLCIEVRPIFRCSESGEELRLPLHRGPNYWTFAHAIAPAPEVPVDPLLRSALLG